MRPQASGRQVSVLKRCRRWRVRRIPQPWCARALERLLQVRVVAGTKLIEDALQSAGNLFLVIFGREACRYVPCAIEASPFLPSMMSGGLARLKRRCEFLSHSARVVVVCAIAYAEHQAHHVPSARTKPVREADLQRLLSDLRVQRIGQRGSGPKSLQGPHFR
jgi:hypothetical protein